MIAGIIIAISTTIAIAIPITIGILLIRLLIKANKNIDQNNKTQ